jgi:hypothetical protein
MLLCLRDTGGSHEVDMLRNTKIVDRIVASGGGWD